MLSEWETPTSEEILKGLLQAGLKGEQIVFATHTVDKGIEDGEIRENINCFDHVIGFFEMANRMYVKKEGMMLTDAELGIHVTKCESPICKKLGSFYSEVLRPAKTESTVVIDKLQKLAKNIVLGKPRHDLEGKESIAFCLIKPELTVLKAVEITDKCLLDRQLEKQTKKKNEVTLSYVLDYQNIFCEIKDNSGMSAFNITKEFTADDENLIDHALILGIDPQLLRIIILANAPQIKLLEEKK